MRLDFSKVFEWSIYYERAGSKDGSAKDIALMHTEARLFLEHFNWCAGVLEEYVGFIYPGIVAVFLFRIRPAREGVDEWVWIVVGDLPPAYITCEESPNPAAALDAYIGAMEEWVDAASRGASTDGLIPVNVAPTAENGERLKLRLELIDKNILSGYLDDLGRPSGIAE
ncbi:hypothetical protein GPA19_24690 [Azoarcus indigens]|uniref:hypothetical protein n=1 Tax=Azoarcus indigens TaxID=29545 RepID=UPI001061F4CB|nr:hypothetical protein [Azoarcus indigens]NMG68132.1 hypothetical protein [Azoarcus indigens]